MAYDAAAAKLLACPATTAPDATVEVVTLLGHRYVVYYLFAITSFLRFTRKDYAVRVYDDGTLTRSDVALIQSQVPGVEIQAAYSSEFQRLLVRYVRCERFSREHVLAPKLFSIMDTHCSRSVLLDSDILFFREPRIMEAWAQQNDSTILYARDAEACSTLLDASELDTFGVDPIPHFNAGLMCVPGTSIDLPLVEHALGVLESKPRPDGRWIWEQTIWAIAAARTTHRPLPGGYSFVNQDTRLAKRPMDRITSRHYSGASRRLFFDEGLKYLVSHW